MNRATQRLRKRIRESRRNATQIREKGESLIAELAKGARTSYKDRLTEGLKEIVDLATKMDARTGTIDPSLKKEER